MRRLIALALTVWLALLALPAGAEAPLRLGVLAFRPKVQAVAQWQPLATYLGTALGRPVKLVVYDLAELEMAVGQKEVDVVLTNPGHYALLQHRFGLSAPLATQINQEGQHGLASFGGVIFTRSDAQKINTLSDLVGQRIVVTSTDFLGGYQMQAFEMLEEGLPLPAPEKLLTTGMPQDLPVQAVLAGRADVGFVRTGVLEAMAHEGKLDLGRIKVINQQALPSFPYVSSTRLYPEWPVAVVEPVDDVLARRLAVALLSLPTDSAAARGAGIRGFTTPANYAGVERLLHTLRLPPFDVTPEITLADLWKKYAGWIVATGWLGLLLAGMAVRLLFQKRALQQSRARYRQESQRLAEVIWATHIGTWEWNVQTGSMVVNTRWAEIIGCTLDELAPISADLWKRYMQPDDFERSNALVERCFRREVETYECEIRMRHKQGNWVWVLSRGRVVEWQDDGKPLRMSGTLIDIAERKEVELALQTATDDLAGREALLKQILDTSSVAIFLVGKDGRIMHANQRMADMFGIPLATLLGKEYVELIHPSEREAGRQSMLALLDSQVPLVDLERRYWHTDGTEFWGHLTGKRFRGDREDGYRLLGVIGDITARKQAELREQHHRQVLAMLAEKAPLPDVLQAIARNIESINRAHLCSILLLDEEGQTLRLGAAPSLPAQYLQTLDGLSVGPDAGLCGTVAFTGEPLVVDDMEHHAAWSPRVYFARQAGLRAYWSSPIRSAQGKVLGTFAIYLRYASQPTPEDRHWMEDEARLIALAIEKTADEARLQLAASVFTHVREGITIADINGSILEVNDTFTQITGYSREEVMGRNPRILSSGRQGPEFYQAMWGALTDKGYWSGEIWNRRKNGEVYAQLLTISAMRDAQGVVQNYVAVFMDIMPMKAQQLQLEHIAHFDALTGLPNRVLLGDRLQHAMAQAQRRDRALAVAFLDLDGFKVVNDMHGHNVGDQLLVTVAQRMKSALREGDTLARIGGDEFVAVLVDLNETRESELVLERLLHAAADPVTVEDAVMQVSVSIGVTLYPQDDVDADQLIRHADQAMYLAKQAGRNRYHLFDVANAVAVKTRRESLGHIQRGLEQREFVLYYQPKVNMVTGEVVGAEALIRWQHPERGLLSPAAFLSVIENHSLSVAVGEWVIETALSQMTQWRAMGLHIPVSVNIGAYQLQRANFSGRLFEMLGRYSDLPPGSLELEVLETSAMEDIGQVSQVMRTCHAMGVGFALDDFGTGYSSLTYLKNLPAEVLKIDQSFVRDMLRYPDDLAIVQSVIDLARAFGRSVIAEGVETAAHGQRLQAMGCHLAQGYGIARPMPAQDFPGWAERWHTAPTWTA
jgi:diguanylate cyclase (GGDEF)-like protein/PAS domain S-box-containing protein